MAITLNLTLTLIPTLTLTLIFTGCEHRFTLTADPSPYTDLAP